MPKHGKKYREAAALVDRDRLYSPEEAIELLKKISYTKFDGTVELHLRLGVDPRHADQQVRGVVVLPHGTGKQTRILVFAEGEAAHIAEEAGADYVGTDELIQKIQNGWLDFDIAIAVPQVMGKVGRLGRILGPRGLMPSPRTDTVVQPDDLPRVIREARLGRVEYRVDRTGNIHVPIGKVSFPKEHLLENLATMVDAINRARPAAAKGTYIRKAYLTATMSPSIKLDPMELAAMRVS
ncbi:MAG TPA: 50S ribosomal protein L1 [Caldilineae bacterium]|nr:50S ribosomal protein L1 [Caldilineae bacterium]